MDPALRRVKVTISDPRPRVVRAEPEYHRARAQPPPRGLDTFDLGSVPASVTPPRTWRKAAWFATLSSSGVVVALLVAGSVLVSQPPAGPQAVQGWLERHGGAPMLPGEGYADGGGLARDGLPATAAAATRTSWAPASGSVDDRVGPAPRESAPSSAPEPTTAQSPTTTQPPTTSASATPETTSATPQKPPVTPATTSRAPKQGLWSPYNANTMAKRSQDYFNTVTEDPETAYAMTTGELAAEGPGGLRQRYADVAYFEVEEVYIDSNEGFTVNTVEVTYKDGTTQRQSRKLEFSRSEKIESEHA